MISFVVFSYYAPTRSNMVGGFFSYKLNEQTYFMSAVIIRASHMSYKGRTSLEKAFIILSKIGKKIMKEIKINK